MGDALIDVWFSLLGLSYSLAHTYKFLKKLFFSCTVDFKCSFYKLQAYHVGLNALLVATRNYNQRLRKKDIYSWP